MKKMSKNLENYNILIVVLSVFLLSSILGSQAKAELWEELSGDIYYDGGNVGIGTTSTGSDKLKVSTGGQYFRVGTWGAGVTDAGWTNTLMFSNQGTYHEINNNVGGPLALQYSNAGKVGIGTNGPVAKLEIRNYGSATLDGLKVVTSDAAGSQASKGALIVQGYAFGQTGTSLIVGSRTFGSGFGLLDVQTNDNTSTGNGTSVFYVRGDGNIGIGTASPNRKLTVYDASTPRIAISGPASSEPGIEWYDAGAGLKWVLYRPSSVDDLRFYFNGQGDLLTLKPNGNVGIGTTNPLSKLAVDGTIRATEVIVKTNIQQPDYVFNDDYNLMKLDVLEKNIKENGHLPNIPSAEEVAENGVGVGEMQVKLLQKVEELTLYVIDLKKENEMLKNRVSSLEVK